MINADVLIRSALALGILLGGVGLYLLYTRLTIRRSRGLASELGSLRPGIPVLVYFTTPTCAPCKTIQRPAIEQVRKELGDRLEVIEIDASEQPDMASRWGVLSVPTTYLIDPLGQVRYVNHGVTRQEKLLQQVKAVLE
jgi:thiol-disulfide isomerase/thioredoxin